MAPAILIPTTQPRGALLSAAPHVARAAAATSSAVLLSRRDLTVNDAQKVTLGIIAAYVVAIALLWNLPYIRWVLWPFKVRPPLSPPPQKRLGSVANLGGKDARNRLPRIRPRHRLRLHGRARQVYLARPARGRRDAHAGRAQRHHPARGVPGFVADRCATDVCGVQHQREQDREYRCWGVFPADAVVGKAGLVDDWDDFGGGWVVGGMLVYCACGGVEVCGAVYWGDELVV